MRRQSGYGFVHYAISGQGIQAAIRAATTLDDITVESVNYKCSLSHNLNKYLTGELAMPDDSPVSSHPHTPHTPHTPTSLGGFNELDSDQYFGAPPQQSYAPPQQQGGGGYRPGLATSHSHPNLSSYGQQPPPQQYGAPALPQYQYVPSGANRYAQVYRPNNPPPPPAHVRAHSYGNAPSNFPPVHPELQPQYGSGFDPRGRYPEAPAADHRFQQAPGPGGYQNYAPDEPSQGHNQNSYGQHHHPQQGRPGARPYNAPPQSAPVGGGAYGRQNQYSSGSATLAALGGMSRGNPPPGPYGAQQGQYARAPAAQPTQFSSHGHGASGPEAAPHRWSPAYNVTPPGEVEPVSPTHVGSSKPAVLAPGRQPLPGQHQPPPQHYQQAAGFHGHGHPQGHQFAAGDQRDVAGITSGMQSMSMHAPQQAPFHHQGAPQPWQQPIAPQIQQAQFAHAYPQNAAGLMAQAPAPPGPQFGLTYTVNQQNGGVTVHVSPPCSPLTAYGASPIPGSGQLAYNPFLGGGFSPLISTYGPVSASPSVPRDVQFEENLSNAHNLFTPSQYAQHSPLLSARDLHYSPSMYQGNFSAAGNAFNQNGSAYPVGQGHGQNGFTRRQAAQGPVKTKKSPLGELTTSTSSTAATASAPAAAVATDATTTTESTQSAAAVAPSDVDGTGDAGAKAAAAEEPTLASAGSFFGAAPADGSPLEHAGSLEATAGDAVNRADTLAGAEVEQAPAAQASEQDAAAEGAQTQSLGGTPSKAGTSRRNMIIKHAKQLVE
jgi:hypothetical protein